MVCLALGRLAPAGPDLTQDPASIVLIVSAEHQTNIVQIATGGHTPPGLAGIPGDLRPLLRRPPANPGLADSLALTRTFVLEDVPAQALDSVLDLLAASAMFEGIAIDGVGGAHSDDDDSHQLPPDDLFPLQYALHNTGQEVGGQAGRPNADIRAPEAWVVSKGSPEVTIAVFDSGVSHSHPDLAPKLVPGWNFVSDSAQTDDRYTSHGTHCAGIIGAVTGNREGIAGIAQRCRLMPVVVLNKYGFGNESTLAEALVWTADQGVPVASISLGFDPEDGGAADRMLRAAVEYAAAQGMLICASSGNVPTQRIGAPARYPQTIAVGATDNRDRRWASTSTGPEMSVAAPGFEIISTWDSDYHDPGQDTYEFKSGTSQACPHVAGVAGLVVSINPRLTPARAKAIIEDSARDLGAIGWDPEFGHGRVDAAAAAAAAVASRSHPSDGHDSCIGDFNGDHVVDTRDFIAYLEAFRNQTWRADIAEPRGVWDSRDLLAFLTAWATGCPD